MQPLGVGEIKITKTVSSSRNFMLSLSKRFVKISSLFFDKLSMIDFNMSYDYDTASYFSIDGDLPNFFLNALEKCAKLSKPRLK